eukprot:NODE_1014_length_2193_cov_0.126074.p1 type:complete len:108 gc:universal NODE_1014_length_2193_cov_0.126074:560-883(+)
MEDLKGIGRCIPGIYHYLMKITTKMALLRLKINQLLAFVEYLKRQQEQGKQRDSIGRLIDVTSDVAEQQDIDNFNGDTRDASNETNNDDLVDFESEQSILHLNFIPL